MSMKPISLSAHALGYTLKRGFTEDEVKEAIRTRPWKSADAGRMECEKDFPFNGEWNRKHYSTKRVRSVFVEKLDRIVVVTVYTYFF